MKTEILTRLIDRIADVVKHTITVGASVWIIYIIADKVDKVVDLTKFLIIFIIALIILLGMVWRFLGRKTAEMSSHSKALEKELDSKRSSSGLTKEGKTHPKDK